MDTDSLQNSQAVEDDVVEIQSVKCKMESHLHNLKMCSVKQVTESHHAIKALLEELDSFHMSLGNLRVTQIGKSVTRVENEVNDCQLKQMATALNNKWKDVVHKYRENVKSKIERNKSKQLKKSQENTPEESAKTAAQSTPPVILSPSSSTTETNNVSKMAKGFLLELKDCVNDSVGKLVLIESNIENVKNSIKNVNKKLDGYILQLEEASQEKAVVQNGNQVKKVIAQNAGKVVTKNENQGLESEMPALERQPVLVPNNVVSPKVLNSIDLVEANTSSSESTKVDLKNVFSKINVGLSRSSSITNKDDCVKSPPIDKASNDSVQYDFDSVSNNNNKKNLNSKDSNRKIHSNGELSNERPVKRKKLNENLQNNSNIKSSKTFQPSQTTSKPVYKAKNCHEDENCERNSNHSTKNIFQKEDADHVKRSSKGFLTSDDIGSKAGRDDKTIRQTNLRQSTDRKNKEPFTSHRSNKSKYINISGNFRPSNSSSELNVDYQKTSHQSSEQIQSESKKTLQDKSKKIQLIEAMPKKPSMKDIRSSIRDQDGFYTPNGILIKGAVAVNPDEVELEGGQQLDDVELEPLLSFSQVVDEMGPVLNDEERTLLLTDKSKHRTAWNKRCKNNQGTKFATLVNSGGRMKAAHRASVGREGVYDIVQKNMYSKN